jgi:hypothetical protein
MKAKKKVLKKNMITLLVAPLASLRWTMGGVILTIDTPAVRSFLHTYGIKTHRINGSLYKKLKLLAEL